MKTRECSGSNQGIQVEQLKGKNPWASGSYFQGVVYLGGEGNGDNVTLGEVPPILSFGSSGDPTSDLSGQGEDDRTVGYPALALGYQQIHPG